MKDKKTTADSQIKKRNRKHELHEFTRIKNRGTNNQITDSTNNS
jgi:hypothetical protein